MSDQNTSSVTPAQPESAAPSTATSSAMAAASEPNSFGTSRGSGLARGKRATVVAPSAANAAPRGEYKPTAVQVIVAEREYQNPFAPETPPAAELPAPVSTSGAAVTATIMVSASTTETPSASTEPVITATPSAQPPGVAESTAAEETPAEKASITILPPAEPRRPASSWDSSTPRENDRPATRREDRPAFRPERSNEGSRGEGYRSQASGDQREFRRDGREPRYPRESREGRSPRDNRDNRGNRGPGGDRDNPSPKTFSPVRPTAPASSTEAKSGGFVGWLKGLFGGAPVEAPKAPAPTDRTSNGRDPSRFDDRGGSRRRQGGGGRRFDQRTPRDGQGQGSGEGQDGDGGYRRRRHRGGRGRNRGDFGGPDSRSGGNRDGGDSSAGS